jgi:predicted deacylase
MVYNSGVDGPVIGILAGMHGNEPAATIELQTMMRNGWFNKIKRGSIRIISAANPTGLRWNTRNKAWIDMNRLFSDTIYNQDAMVILKFFEPCDIVIDFHEGWGFHQLQPESLGSTIMPNDDNATIISKNIVEYLNKSSVMKPILAHNSKKAWVVLNKCRPCEIPTTLSCYYQRHGKSHILIETTGQNNIQPIQIRQNQVRIILESLLHFYNIL